MKEVTALKIVVVKSPRLLSGILRLIFGIRKEELT
ncbi:stage V sporulation protein SpoVM [Angelakisella massiliensis]